MNKNITFNIITPSYFGEMQLSLVVLKSYILHKDSDMNININSFFCEDDTEKIAYEIFSQNPSVACFSLYIWTEKKVKDVCSRLKELNKDILIIIGGNVPTYQGKYLLENYNFFDIAVKGEGEETLYQILKQYKSGKIDYSKIANIVFREQGKVIETIRKENFNIEYQNYPILLNDFIDAEIIFYETSRGCIYRCKYCAYNMNFEGKNVMRSYPIEKVINDMRTIFQLPNIKRLEFVDASIVTKRRRDLGFKILRLLNDLNDERRENNKPLVNVAIDISLEDVDDEILYELKRMNVFVYGFGLQTIHEDTLKIARRPFNKEKFTYYFNRLVEKSGAATNLELMFGLPGDTFKKFKETLEYALTELNIYFLVCFRFAVLPGSTFWEEKDKYHLECEKYPPYYLLSTPTFPADDLEKAEKLSFYLQLIFTIFRGIKKTIDKDFKKDRLEVYQKIIDMLSKKYSFFYQNNNLRQGDVYQYVEKLKKPVNKKLKQSMQIDMRELLKDLHSNDRIKKEKNNRKIN